MASFKSCIPLHSHFSLHVLCFSCFFILPFKLVPAPLHFPFCHAFYLFLSLLSLSFSSFSFYLIFPPPSLFSLSLFFFSFTHAHIQIRFNFELFYWTCNQKGLTSWNRSWATKRANCSHLLPFIRFYSEDWIFLLPKPGFRPQETLRGKSSGLKSDIFGLSS